MTRNDILEAVAEHLDLPEGSLVDWKRTPEWVTYNYQHIPGDPVFGPRMLFIVVVKDRTHVLRVMTSPLMVRPSVHEEATL